MEIELGRCAQFCIYHLMDLEPDEERIDPGYGMANGISRGGLLLEPKVATIGDGDRIMSNESFRSNFAFRLDECPSPPTTSSPTHVRQESGQKVPTRHPKTLSDIAKVLRSKNAGPFEITVDIIFDSPEAYHSVKQSDLLNAQDLAKALDVSAEDIVWMGFYDSALAFKVTIPRYRGGKRRPAGSFMENDVHGSQQHLGVAMMELPEQRQGLASPLQSLWTHHKYTLGLLALAAVGASRVAPLMRLISKRA